MATFPTAFTERNKVVIAIVGLLALAIVFALTFNAAALPVIGNGAKQSAHLAESGGLKPGNEVRVAGVKVGDVTDVSLEGDTVVVEFRAKGVTLGDQTRASVKVKTLLGQKFLSLEPAGRGELEGPIPVGNTTTPYDVNAAFSDLSTTVTEIDTDQMEESFQVLTDAFEDTPESVREMVDGLTSLSRTISTRDEELAELLEATSEVSGTLKDRNTEIAGIITQGSSLLSELENRRETVQALLQGTRRLGVQLRGLVKDNEEQLRPALARLDEVSQILQRNQKNLEKAVSLIGPYYRNVTAAMGSGRWIDSYVCGLFEEQDATQRPVLDREAVRNCSPGGKR